MPLLRAAVHSALVFNIATTTHVYDTGGGQVEGGGCVATVDDIRSGWDATQCSPHHECGSLGSTPHEIRWERAAKIQRGDSHKARLPERQRGGTALTWTPTLVMSVGALSLLS